MYCCYYIVVFLLLSLFFIFTFFFFYFFYFACFLFFFFFFFFSSRRRHTRSLRDWSSDVCSSDLDEDRRPARPARPCLGAGRRCGARGRGPCPRAGNGQAGRPGSRRARRIRSEERRVGKECRSRWWADQEKKKVKESEVQSKIQRE